MELPNPITQLYDSRVAVKDVSLIRRELEKGVDINCIIDPPLYIACWCGYHDVCRLLLEFGADPNWKDQTNRRPLWYALDYADKYGYECAYLLIDYGASTDMVFDEWVPEIPKWLQSFIEQREVCRHNAIQLLGMFKFRRPASMGANNRDVMGLIGKHIWSLRRSF